MMTFLRRLTTRIPLDYRSLGLILGVFILVMLFINPLREFGFNDDWAYARMVRNLVYTGAYQTDEWLPAWIPAHIYWGGLFAGILGYSYSSLHVSTVLLAAAGLVGFYWLAREHEVTALDAAVLSLVLMASPLVLQYSVTFMTDIPYLTYLILSLLFYTRGVRLRKHGWMVLGGLSAGCAILTRLFGAAIIPGLGLVWLLDKDRRASLPIFATGMLIPVLAVAVAVYQSASIDTGTASVARLIQQLYFSHPDLVLGHAIWRLMVSLQYMAFFCAPVLIPAILDYRQRLLELRTPPLGPRGRSEMLILSGLTLFLLGASLFGSFNLNQLGVMPLIKWNFRGFINVPAWLTGTVTLATLVGAFLIGRLFILRYLQPSGWKAVTTHERVLDLVTGCIFVVHLVLFELGDRYLLHLIPLTLIVVGRGVAGSAPRFRSLVSVSWVIFVVVSALWVRQTASRAEAQWTAAEALAAGGVSPERISTLLEWNSYYGAYDAFLMDARRRGIRLDDNATYFTDWLPERRRRADYVIFPAPKPPQQDGWKITQTLTYQDMLLRDQKVYVFQRIIP